MLRALLTTVLLALPNAAAATWLRGEVPGVVAYSHGSEADLRARLVQIQKFVALARMLTGLEPSPIAPPLPIYFVNHRELEALDLGAGGFAGFYQAGPGGTYAALATDIAEGQRDTLTVLFHEYAHHLMFQNTRAAYPAWYVEGFASYLGTAVFAPDYTEFGRSDPGRISGLAGPWLPVAKLFTSRVGTAGSIQTFYGESWLAVHYLSRDEARLKLLNAYLAALTAGTKPEPAFKAVFGFDFPELDRQLRNYMHGNRLTVTRMSPLPVSVAPVTVTILPPVYDSLAISARRLASSGWQVPKPTPILPEDDRQQAAAKRRYDVDRLAARKALLATIRRESAHFAGDAFADTLRAEAEVKLGDRADGTARLDAMLAKTPHNADALYLRGATELTTARGLNGSDRATAMKRARVWLTSANAARADDFRILAAHAATFDGTIPDREVPVLLRAAELAPQVAEVQASAALMLAARGDREGAKRHLGPIANNPHGGTLATAAAAMIAAIDKGETPVAPDELTD